MFLQKSLCSAVMQLIYSQIKTQHWSCHLQPLRVYFNIQYNLIQWLFTILSFFDEATETIKKQNSKQWIYNDDTSKLI